MSCGCICQLWMYMCERERGGRLFVHVTSAFGRFGEKSDVHSFMCGNGRRVCVCVCVSLCLCIFCIHMWVSRLK